MSLALAIRVQKEAGSVRSFWRELYLPPLAAKLGEPLDWLKVFFIFEIWQGLVFLQVKLIEGVILAINLIAAVWIGSWMMHGLGTPTRFETPKEGVQRD